MAYADLSAFSCAVPASPRRSWKQARRCAPSPKLTMVERELAVLSVSREKDAAYEWAAHVKVGREHGMREEAIEAMRNSGDVSGLEPDERDIITYVRQLLQTNKVEQDLFDALLSRHDERWLVELTATIGQYQYISAINNAFGLQPPADADQLPV